MKWLPIEQQAAWDHRPGRQFIRIEGSSDHSGHSWVRVFCGEAFIRKPGAEDEMYGYRKSDIERLCKDGDMDLWSARVTHWMPFCLPPVMEAIEQEAASDPGHIKNFM